VRAQKAEVEATANRERYESLEKKMTELLNKKKD